MNMYGKMAMIGLLSAVPLVADAPTREEFDAVVEFGLTLREIAGDPTSASLIDRVVVLDGNIASIVPVADTDGSLSRDDGEFAVRLELVHGTWIELERIEIYRAIVELRGAEFADRVSLSADGGADVLAVNSRVLVVGRVSGLENRAADSESQAKQLAIIEAYYIRQLN